MLKNAGEMAEKNYYLWRSWNLFLSLLIKLSGNYKICLFSKKKKLLHHQYVQQKNFIASSLCQCSFFCIIWQTNIYDKLFCFRLSNYAYNSVTQMLWNMKKMGITCVWAITQNTCKNSNSNIWYFYFRFLIAQCSSMEKNTRTKKLIEEIFCSLVTLLRLKVIVFVWLWTGQWIYRKKMLIKCESNSVDNLQVILNAFS